MAHGELTRSAERHRPGPGRRCSDCGSRALVTHRVREHLPCGHVYFRDDAGEGDDCPKCGKPLRPEGTTRRGAVDRCAACRRTTDATPAPDGA